MHTIPLTIKGINMNIEDNNTNKIAARMKVIQAIEEHHDNAPKIMLELLGAGVGAIMFTRHLKNIKELHLVERDTDKVAQIKSILGNLTALCTGFNLRKPKTVVVNTDIYTWLSMVVKEYTIVNLDFCGYFTDTPSESSYNTIIKELFDTELILNNGLFFLTTQIAGGWSTRSNASITEPKDIKKKVGESIGIGGMESELILEHTYNSGNGSKMLVLGYKVYY